MTVAERIKRETNPLSIERYKLGYKNALKGKGKGIVWGRGFMCRDVMYKKVTDVVYAKMIFIDGSTLECRAYL